MIGNVMSTLLRGNMDFDNATQRVNVCIDSYTSAAVDLSCALGMRLISYTREVQASVDALSERVGTLVSALETQAQIVENKNTPSTASCLSFVVPYERNPMFHGRDSLLNQIHSELSKNEQKRYNHRLAIYGLGGIGKTQIALEYAFRNKADYDCVFWIHGEDRTSFVTDLANIALEAKCVAVKDDNPETLAHQVLKWLRQRGGWLVILDNLDDVAVVRDLLPMSECGGHVLATTRNSNAKSIPMEGLEIAEMEEPEAVELLLQLSEYSSDAQTIVEAKQIVCELGRLPLAIDQSAAFIRMSNFMTFLDGFQLNLSQLLKKRSEGPSLYPDSLFTTWTLSLTRLSPNATQLVQIFALLNPDEILIEFLQAGLEELKSGLRTLIENKFTFIQAVSELRSLSLIKLRDHRQQNLDPQISAVRYT